MDMSSIERGSEKGSALGQRALGNVLVRLVFLSSHPTVKRGRISQYQVFDRCTSVCVLMLGS